MDRGPGCLGSEPLAWGGWSRTCGRRVRAADSGRAIFVLAALSKGIHPDASGKVKSKIADAKMSPLRGTCDPTGHNQLVTAWMKTRDQKREICLPTVIQELRPP